MKKYIHYCWFGGKKLSKLANDCLKSWEKFLPDYEIKRWDETNCNINECPFVKEAYENKKYAFVADYFRTKVLNEYGGIYFDTDMKVIKDISKILKDKTILGFEDSGNIAAGFWYEPQENGFITKELLQYYQSQSCFDMEHIYNYSIPKLITKILNKDGLIMDFETICDYENITIYPREYFYPLSYDKQNNIFTDNTYMVHYYDASWTPKREQREVKLVRKYGNGKAKMIIAKRQNITRRLKKIAKCLLFPLVNYRNKKRLLNKIMMEKQNFKKELELIKNNDVLAIYRKEWLGTSAATKDMFPNNIGINNIESDDYENFLVYALINTQSRLIIFSAFDLSWINLIKKIKKVNPQQRLKILWHGSNAMNIEQYDWQVMKTIFELLDNKIIESIGFVKKSLYEFYKSKGYNVEFVMNYVSLSKISVAKKKSDKVRIGVYASGDRWLKNFYNQLSAASMIENHIIDCIPINEKTLEFGKLIKAKITGSQTLITREEMLERLSCNDINLYVTFVECAPILPLESFEMGVPCITSKNHHYWENTKLGEYVLVDSPDDIIKIKEKIEVVLKNKEEILKLYNEWKKDYEKEAKQSIANFIK